MASEGTGPMELGGSGVPGWREGSLGGALVSLGGLLGLTPCVPTRGAHSGPRRWGDGGWKRPRTAVAGGSLSSAPGSGGWL